MQDELQLQSCLWQLGSFNSVRDELGVVPFIEQVLLMMRSQELAPTANFKTLNPKIDFKVLLGFSAAF
eukprot:4455398-Amphidinium_carterae.1